MIRCGIVAPGCRVLCSTGDNFLHFRQQRADKSTERVSRVVWWRFEGSKRWSELEKTHKLMYHTSKSPG